MEFPRFSPFLFAGAGISYLKIKRDWSGFNAAYFNGESQAPTGLGLDSVHKTPAIIPVLPFGAGVLYYYSSRISLELQSVYHITTSDYIDGFKYSGNANKKDRYYGFLMGIHYKLGNNRYKCPPVRN
jgi:hypothetical protein